MTDEQNAKPEADTDPQGRLDALVSLLLRRGYYEVDPRVVGEGAQLVHGRWYMPRLGCDTLQMVIDEFGDELAS
jgi:hypothetical protein